LKSGSFVLSMDISSLLVLGVHVVDQVNDPVGVAVLVIVPRKKIE
jgi:hypothetical protein